MKNDPLEDMDGGLSALLAFLIIFLLMILIASNVFACDLTDEITSIRDDVPEDRVKALSDTICSYSDQYRLDEHLVAAIITTETHWRNIKGKTGEAGYMQIKPATFERACGYPTTLDRLLYDWRENIRCGIKHLSNLRDEMGLLNAVGSYNAGSRYGHRNLDYVRKVLNNYEQIHG